MMKALERVRSARGAAVPALAIAVLAACGTPVQRFTVADTSAATDWSGLFVERQIQLQLPDSGAPLRRIGKVVVGRDGELFVPDGRSGRILHFDRNGVLRGQITGAADGSYRISALGTIALDPDGNLVVYDRDGSQVTVLDPATRRAVRQFRIEGPVSDLVATEDGEIVTYYPDHAAGVFRRFDRNGRKVGAAHPIRDEKLRAFHGRVQNGGIARDASGDLFGIEPSRFQLVHLSPDLDVRAIYRGDSADAWAPTPKRFPAGLNPNDYREAHRAWWDSFMHIGRPFTLGRGLVLVTIFDSNGLASRRDYANLYGTNGEIRARGLEVPRGGHIVSAGDGTVYVVRDARVGAGDAILPVELYEYRLREGTTVAAASPR